MTSTEHFYADTSSYEYDRGLGISEEIPVIGFAVASDERNTDFHELFPQIPEGDHLIEDYGCALQSEILIQGRMYISENHICFHANICGWITDLTISINEILSLEKKMTALFIPNALQVITRTSNYTFASFLSRDTAFDVIHNIWRLVRPDSESVQPGSASGRASFVEPELPPSIPPPAVGMLPPSPALGKVSQCKCVGKTSHFLNTALVATFPGTPEKIYNLMFTNGDFTKFFLQVDQKLKDLQVSDWTPRAGTQLLSRERSFVKLLNGFVKQTRCELLDETLHCDTNDYICILTTTKTPDVPNGGVFLVKTKTCITWASAATTKVVVTNMVDWIGSSFMKGMINNSVAEGQKKYHLELERAMRKHIAEHKDEFVTEGMEEVLDPPPVIEAAVEETVVARTCGKWAPSNRTTILRLVFFMTLMFNLWVLVTVRNQKEEKN